MSGSFGKRARALVAFGVGMLPVAASAQTVVPNCDFLEKISDRTVSSGDVYNQDGNPFLRGWMTLNIEASKIKPNDKKLLATPGAMLGIAYNWQPGTIAAYALEVRSPYKEGYPAAATSYAGVINIDGMTHAFTMQAGANNWVTLDGFPTAGDYIAKLKKDITLTLTPSSGGKPMVFTFSKKDAVKAYNAAVPRFEALAKKAEAGECKPVQRGSSGGGSSGSACFLTTATCEAVGLADDCWELRTLRKFRDDWLANQQGGMDDIKAYYAKAPAIAERLKQDPQALLRLYWTRIVPSALAAQIGANRLARTIYSKGMRELAAA